MPAHMLFGLAGAGGQSSFVTAKSNYSESFDTVDRSTYTFGSTNVPTIVSGGKLLLALVVDDSGANSTTSVTYKGISMALVAGPVSAANDYVEIWELDFPSGDSGAGAVVVTLANTALGVALIGTALSGFSSSAVYDTATSTADPAVLTIDVPSGGAIFAIAHATGASAGGSWTNLVTNQGNITTLGTQSYDNGVSAGLAAEVNRAVSFDFTNGANFKACAVSYG